MVGFGVVVAIFTYTKKTLISSVMAIWTGLIIGEALNNLLLIYFEPRWLYWTTNSIIMVICLVVVCRDANGNIIWMTATYGSYMMIKSVAYWLGEFPLKFNISELY